MGKKVRHAVHATMVLRLLVALEESSEDQVAISMLKKRFNGSLQVARVQPARGEVFPQLWEAGVCYSGLADIEEHIRANGW